MQLGCVIDSLSCVMSVYSGGDGASCLGMLVIFVVDLGLRCSLVLWYTLPLTLIRYVIGSIVGLGLLRMVPGIQMLRSVSLA